MGIFNFLKDVGHKLFDHEHTGQAAAPAQGESKNNELSAKLQQYIEKLGLGIENPKVTVQGDKATLEGKAASQEALEKAILALGNTNGIAQVESRVEAPAATQPKFHTVEKGDTLSKIAKEVYGDANRYPEIFEANKPMLKSPDAIFPGQQLRIPEQARKAA